MNIRSDGCTHNRTPWLRVESNAMLLQTMNDRIRMEILGLGDPPIPEAAEGMQLLRPPGQL